MRMERPFLCQRLKRQAGFTFHEALLAIALVGIISAIAVPIVSNSHDESRLRVLRSNVRQMNNLLREAHRFGAQGTTDSQLKGSKGAATVSDVCSALTINQAVFVDNDGDGTLDPHEFAFQMDLPPNTEPYSHLVAQFLTNGYNIQIKGDAPIQLAIYVNGLYQETP